MNRPNTQHEDRDALRRRMQEAAALPPHDPQRLSLLREIVEAGPRAEEEWLELVCADERARLELQRIEVPAGLLDRLRSLPEEAPGPYRRWFPSWIRRRGAVAAAAALLLAAALALGLPRLGGGRELESRLQTLGLLAADQSGMEMPLTVSDTDPERVRAALDPQVKWDLRLPELGPAYRFLGARVCRLGGHDVVLTRWARGDRTYTVFEFCATDYELPARFERRVVEAAPPWPGGAPRRIEFWSVEGPCAYAMVAEPAEEKHRRSEARPSEGQPGSPDRPAASEPGPHEKQARNPAITRAAVPQF